VSTQVLSAGAGPATVRDAGLVDIVSGSFGAGHDAAARAIADQLRRRGYQTRISDIVDLMPGPLGRTLRAAFLHHVQLAPSSYGWLIRYGQRHGSVNAAIAQGMECAHPALLRLAADQPAAMISTHPLASQALGELRARGRLRTPVTTYLTDMSVHRVLVHGGVDLHLALHELPAQQAVGLGAGATQVVQAALPGAFSSARSQAACRLALGLPLDRRLVLVTGGSCGIGDLEQSADDIAATGVATPVVLCGHNERLRQKLQATRSPSIALGWIDDMALVLGAVDAVVQNSGGFTSLETLAAGLPILSYRCLAGHGETNADALERAGLVAWIKTRAGLRDGLNRALATSGAGLWKAGQQGRPDVVEAVFAESRVEAT
jgi:processive 1,2-diacylglycerol beta-glucosyltransferase